MLPRVPRSTCSLSSTLYDASGHGLGGFQTQIHVKLLCRGASYFVEVSLSLFKCLLLAFIRASAERVARKSSFPVFLQVPTFITHLIYYTQVSSRTGKFAEELIRG